MLRLLTKQRVVVDTVAVSKSVKYSRFYDVFSGLSLVSRPALSATY
jgi:hypothetical protein